MGSRFPRRGFSHRQRRHEGVNRRSGKASRRRPTWIGLEGLESRMLLSGALEVFGGTALTTAIASGDTTLLRADGTDFAEAAAGR